MVWNNKTGMLTTNNINLQLCKFMEDVIISETDKIMDQNPLSYSELLLWVVGFDFDNQWIQMSFILVDKKSIYMKELHVI